MKSTTPNPTLINLESIRQQELKKQVHRDLKNEALYQTKAKAIRWFQLLTLFTLIVLLTAILGLQKM